MIFKQSNVMIETEQTGDEEFDLSTVVNKGIVRYRDFEYESMHLLLQMREGSFKQISDVFLNEDDIIWLIRMKLSSDFVGFDQAEHVCKDGCMHGKSWREIFNNQYRIL